MTDRELTEVAAKAVGLGITWEPVHNCHWVNPGQGIAIEPWTPLDDDAQAHALIIKILKREQPREALNKFYADIHFAADEAAVRRLIVETIAALGALS